MTNIVHTIGGRREPETISGAELQPHDFVEGVVTMDGEQFVGVFGRWGGKLICISMPGLLPWNADVTTIENARRLDRLYLSSDPPLRDRTKLREDTKKGATT